MTAPSNLKMITNFNLKLNLYVLMKKLIIMLLAIVPFTGMAQKDKEIKPSIPKAEKALREGKLDVAKSTIDITVASREFMKDKKGQPSKNAALAWYMRGLIYIAIDTTQKEQFKALEPNPYTVAVASFDSCQAIDKGKTPAFIKDPGGVLPMMNDQVSAQFAQKYLTTSLHAYSKEKDYKKAFMYIERVLYFIPNDTSMLMNAGVYFGPAANENDKSIAYINKYLEKGGTNPDANIQLINIYLVNKKDNQNALKAIRAARAKYPDNPEFPKYELNIYLADKKYDQARKYILVEIKSHPKEKQSFLLLGQLYEELGKPDSAKIAYQKAIDIDPDYYEANIKLATIFYADGKKIKQERDKLGITAKDIEKRKELLLSLREKYKIALPYVVKCEKLKPDDELVLFTLADIYNALVMDEELEKINKKIKELGLDK
jgi:tetratricopeptide (TPR) repeat protein